ncbi:MAG: DUF5660 domain-containing protein [bacterium]|nr:DUF5660 domain-containing protein [bacterium]
MNHTMYKSGGKSKSTKVNKNPLEAITDLGSSTFNKAKDEFKKIGTGMVDDLFGINYDSEPTNGNEFGRQQEGSAPKKHKQEFKLFNYNEYYERELVKKQIKELTEQIKQQIEMIKKADASLLNDIKDIQKLSIDSLPATPGIYHVRFLEIILNILKTVRQKIGESRTWLQALQSKKKKRGSAFAVRSKKQGTQYSMSQELQNARSIQ